MEYPSLESPKYLRQNPLNNAPALSMLREAAEALAAQDPSTMSFDRLQDLGLEHPPLLQKPSASPPVPSRTPEQQAKINERMAKLRAAKAAKKKQQQKATYNQDNQLLPSVPVILQPEPALSLATSVEASTSPHPASMSDVVFDDLKQTKPLATPATGSDPYPEPLVDRPQPVFHHTPPVRHPLRPKPSPDFHNPPARSENKPRNPSSASDDGVDYLRYGKFILRASAFAFALWLLYKQHFGSKEDEQLEASNEDQQPPRTYVLADEHPVQPAAPGVGSSLDQGVGALPAAAVTASGGRGGHVILGRNTPGFLQSNAGLGRR